MLLSVIFDVNGVIVFFLSNGKRTMCSGWSGVAEGQRGHLGSSGSDKATRVADGCFFSLGASFDGGV